MRFNFGDKQNSDFTRSTSIMGTVSVMTSVTVVIKTTGVT